MKYNTDYKKIELDRYNNRSKSELLGNNLNKKKIGPNSVKYSLREPYIYYQKLILNHSNKNSKVLDLCCGDGTFSFISSKNNSQITISDISPESIELAKKMSKKLNLEIDCFVSDAENLPFKEKSFDLITLAGSLSYLDHNIFFKQIHKILKPNGLFICIDSFNHNIFYRINRYLHYLMGNRSYGTLLRMPNDSIFKKIENNFNVIEKKYFGILVFLYPILKFFFNEKSIFNIFSITDKYLKFFKNQSFKIVFLVQKK